MKTHHDIAKAIIDGNFTVAELHIINAAVREAYDMGQRRARLAFNVGEEVDCGAKWGKGVVKSIGPKNLVVTLHRGGALRISPSLVKKVG